jgi:hypothetical protein
MVENTYSLEKLAWLSRCLFPHDFRDELIEMGVDKDDAIMLSMMVHTSEKGVPRSLNILEVYQECLACITPDIYTKIIDDYCKWWLEKNNHNWR